MDPANGYVEQIISQLVDSDHIAVSYVISLLLQPIKPMPVNKEAELCLSHSIQKEANLFF